VTFSETKKAIFTNMTLIDNTIGAVVNVGLEGDDLWAIMRNSKFYGETEQRDCAYKDFCKLEMAWDNPECVDRYGMVLS